LFSFSNSAFFYSKASSVDTGLTLTFDNQLMFSSLGCIHVGIKSVTFLALKLRGVHTKFSALALLEDCYQHLSATLEAFFEQRVLSIKT